eukprot:5557227-Prymnesium_polylepis.1
MAALAPIAYPGIADCSGRRSRAGRPEGRSAQARHRTVKSVTDGRTSRFSSLSLSRSSRRVKT